MRAIARADEAETRASLHATARAPERLPNDALHEVLRQRIEEVFARQAACNEHGSVWMVKFHQQRVRSMAAVALHRVPEYTWQAQPSTRSSAGFTAL